MLDTHYCCETFSDVVPRKRVPFQQLVFLCITVDATRQCAAQTRHVGATVFVSNDVGVAKNALAERVGPLKGKFDRDRALFDFLFALDDDNILVHWNPTAVDLTYELCKTPFIVMFADMLVFAAVIGNDDFQPCVQERCFFQPGVDLVKVKFGNVREN